MPTTTGTITVTPTIECIGVVSAFSGDTGANNDALLEYRERYSETWIPAFGMYRDPARLQYRGSIWGLRTNTEYEVRVTYTDPQGVTGENPLIRTVRTRNDNPAIGLGTTYFVDGVNGNDSNPGTELLPFRTPQRAANVVNPGDLVFLKGATYSDPGTDGLGIKLARSGLPDAYITWAPYDATPVVMDGLGSIQAIFQVPGSYHRFMGGPAKNFIMTRNYERSLIFISGHGIIIEDCQLLDPNLASNGYAAVRWFAGSSNGLYQRNIVRITQGNAGTRGTIYGFYGKESGPGHVIRDNDMSGGVAFRDGVAQEPEDNSAYWNDIDILRNLIVGAKDDGIQTEQGGNNIRVYGNILHDCFFAFATCPVLVGPTYIFRNKSSGGSFLKIGDYSTGRIYLIHNTHYSPISNGWGQTNAGGPSSIRAWNNIMRCGRYVYEIYSSGNDLEMDYNALFTSDATGRFISWGTRYPNLAAFQTARGQELHSLQVEPGFVAPAAGDLRLRSDSICIDRGIRLVGFNDANSPWPYRGAAPDLGAIEYGTTPPPPPPPPSEQTISLVPGESKVVSFEAIPHEAGVYSVTVDGLHGSFRAL